MTATSIERYVWRFLLVVPLVGLLVAVKGLITGAPANPALVGALTGLDWEQLRTQQPGVAQLVGVLKRHESVALLGWAFWLAWTNIHGDRFRSSWVWYGWWTVPILCTGFILTGAGVGGGLGGVLLGVAGMTVVGLLLARRWFLVSSNPSA